MKQHALKVSDAGLSELLETHPLPEALRLLGAFVHYRCGRGLAGISKAEGAKLFPCLDPDWTRRPTGPLPKDKEEERRKRHRAKQAAEKDAFDKGLETIGTKDELRLIPPLEAARRLLRVPEHETRILIDLEGILHEFGEVRFRKLLEEVFDAIARGGTQGEGGRFWPFVKFPHRLFFKYANEERKGPKLPHFAAPSSTASPSSRPRRFNSTASAPAPR